MDRKIVVVEDDPDIRALLQMELRASGYGVEFARDGLAAVTLLRQTTVDLILVDIGLPAGDGFTVIERIKYFPALEGVPIIVITANTSTLTRERAMAAGAYAFIEKPFNTDSLLRMIHSALLGAIR